MIVTGGNLGGAMWFLVEVETLANHFFNTLQIGGPNILCADQMQDVRKAMAGGYGRSKSNDES